MSEKSLEVPFYNVRLLAVYLLPCFEIKTIHAEFFICYVPLESLQNGKKCWKKKFLINVKNDLHCQ